MFPVIYQNRFFTIYSIGLFITLSILAFALVFFYLRKKKNLKTTFLTSNLFWIVVAIFLSSELFSLTRVFLETKLDDFSLEIVKNTLANKSFNLLGIIYGFLIGIFFITKRTNKHFILWMDILIVPFLFLLSLGELGSFFNGQNIGTATNLPWGVVVNVLDAATFDLRTHPISLYHSILFLILGLYFFQQTHYRHQSGYIFFRSILITSLFLFFLNFQTAERVIIFSIFGL